MHTELLRELSVILRVLCVEESLARQKPCLIPNIMRT